MEETFESMLGKGLAVIAGEVRSARPDQFSYVNKKTGQTVTVKLVRLGLEIGESAEQCEATFESVEVPSWAVKGRRYYFGCQEVVREMRRLSARIVSVVAME